MYDGIVEFMAHTEQKCLSKAQLTDMRDRMISRGPMMPASSTLYRENGGGSGGSGAGE